LAWELPDVMLDEMGLRPSLEMPLGGVNRLPTLVRLEGIEGVGWDEVEYEGYFWCSDDNCGGGSSKLGRCEALGLREEKLVGAPIESDPGIIWDGRATLTATSADGGFYPAGSEERGDDDDDAVVEGNEQPGRDQGLRWL
jgi:hypothetical protein